MQSLLSISSDDDANALWGHVDGPSLKAEWQPAQSLTWLCWDVSGPGSINEVELTPPMNIKKMPTVNAVSQYPAALRFERQLLTG